MLAAKAACGGERVKLILILLLHQSKGLLSLLNEIFYHL